MSHRILVSFTKDEIDELAARERKKVSLFVSHGQDVLREGMQSFARFSGFNDILLVDAERIRSLGHFSVFLKALEDPKMKGEIWFYNAPLSDYPFTIVSRCKAEVKITIGLTDARLEKFLNEQEINTPENVEGMKNLVGYPLDVAWNMLRAKEAFVEFMMLLDSTSNFLLFTAYLDKVKSEFIYLLAEWLHENEIFGLSQLSLCPWLREDSAMFLLDRLSGARTEKDVRLVFVSLLVHKVSNL